MVKQKNGTYIFGMCGRRNDVNIEDVYDFLKNRSSEHNIINTKSFHGSVVGTTYEGEGILEGIRYKFSYTVAEMGLPSLDLITDRFSDDKKIRQIIWTTGWKNK